MYLAFIDEYGTLQASDPENNYYVLTAMVMQEKGMKFLHHKSQELKQELFKLVHRDKITMPVTFELHMQEIKDAKANYKPLRSKREITEDIFWKIYNFIANLYVTIISVVINKEDFFNRYKEEKLIDWSLRLLIERLNEFVIGSAPNELALLIIDEDLAHEKKKREFISRMMDEGIKYKTGDVHKVLDTPIFVKSHYNNGIQLVDSITYLIGRYTRKVMTDEGNSLFDQLSNKFYTQIKSKIWKGKSSVSIIGNGIKFFPEYPPSEYWEFFK